MNGFLCLKGITLSGVAYGQGEPIPRDAVLPDRMGILKSQGYIADAVLPASSAELAAENERLKRELEAAGERVEELRNAKLEVPIYTDEATDPRPLLLEPEELVRALTLLQMYEQHAVDALTDVDSEPMLVLVHRLEPREAVRTAVAARAAQLNPGLAAMDSPKENQESPKDRPTPAEGETPLESPKEPEKAEAATAKKSTAKAGAKAKGGS